MGDGLIQGALPASGLTRRFLLSGLLVAAAGRALPAASAAVPPVTVGAIRWDAWQAPGSPTAQAVVRSLSPARWRHRLPFFARSLPDGGIALDGGTQEVMDLEIALAQRAGLGFWAFLGYPRASPMSLGLKLYLASPRRAGLRFCMISELAQWGGEGRPSEVPDWHLELMRHPDYQQVRGGRPLYFLGFLSDRLIAARWGGPEALRRALAHGAA